MSTNRRPLLLSILLLAFFAASSVKAQTDLEISAAVQFDFTAPGARSLGLGGAFVALADDATAAVTNPAGLVQLTRPEVATEYRSRTFTTTFTDRGRLPGAMPTGLGIDTIAGLIDGETTSRTDNLSYLSFIYPKGPFRFALYRHELTNFATSIETRGAFLLGSFRLFPVRANIDTNISSLGSSIAFAISEEFSIGIGVALYDFELESTATRYGFASNEEPNYSTANIVNRQQLTGSDQEDGITLGLQWKPTKRISIGASYKRAPSFRLAARNSIPNNDTEFNVAASFDVPDTLSVGIAFLPSQSTRLILEVNRVNYSDLTDNVESVFNATKEARQIRTNDANQIHLGFEYLFLRKNPIGLRLGAWYEPDHRARFTGSTSPDPDLQRDALAALFRKGSDEIHYSFGLGIALKNRLQLDVGFDFSDLVDTASLSAVVWF